MDTKIIKLVIFSLLLLPMALKAKDITTPNYTYQNISINQLNWSDNTKTRTTNGQKDFSYIELEGGAGFDWGEFYGFVDIENPTKSYKDTDKSLHVALKPVFDIKLNDNYYLHIQNYLFRSHTYSVNNLIVGLSTKYKTDNFWIIPFLGSHYKDDTYNSELNGYMAGWSFGYNTRLFNENITITQWHEMEFARDKDHYAANGSSHGMQGAIKFFWHIDSNYTVGLQYRYANDTLGYHAYQNAIIYSLKYNF